MTINNGKPTPGLSGFIDFSGGTGKWGGTIGVDYPIFPLESPTPSASAGWGMGAGVAGGLKWTFPIWPWGQDDC